MASKGMKRLEILIPESHPLFDHPPRWRARVARAAAKEKIEVAGAYIGKELRADRKINSVKGVMNRILQMDTGGIKLGCRSPDERKKRLADLDEEKYLDIYLS